MLVELTTLMDVAVVPPNVTAAPVANNVPVIVTAVPPPSGPIDTDSPEMVTPR